MTKSEEQQPLSLQKALQQCELVQNMIDLSISNLEGLRTKCATSNDLTQKEIRTLEVGVACGKKKKKQSFLPSPCSPPPPFPLILFVGGREGVGRYQGGHDLVFCDLSSLQSLPWVSLYCIAVVYAWLGGGSSSSNCDSLCIIILAAVIIIRFPSEEGVLSFFRLWVCLYATGACVLGKALRRCREPT